MNVSIIGPEVLESARSHKAALAKLHRGMALVAEALDDAESMRDGSGLKWEFDISDPKADTWFPLDHLFSVATLLAANGQIAGYRLSFLHYERLKDGGHFDWLGDDDEDDTPDST